MSSERDEESAKEWNSSVIGTKDYWNQCYETELKNYEDFGDFGEIWFGIKINGQIVNWIRDNLSDKQKTTILDIGCGKRISLKRFGKTWIQTTLWCRLFPEFYKILSTNG